MKFVVVGVVAALTGAAISAAILTADDLSPGSVNYDEQIKRLNDRSLQTENALNDISETLSRLEERGGLVNMRRDGIDNNDSVNVSDDETDDAKKTRHLLKSSKEKNKFDGGAVEKKLVSRLNDPAYTSTKTMAEFVGSDEMYHLPIESRKKVIEEMIRKLNDGSIDVSQFTKDLSQK